MCASVAGPYAAMQLFLHAPDTVLSEKDRFLDVLEYVHKNTALDDPSGMWWMIWFYHVFRSLDEVYSNRFRSVLASAYQASIFAKDVCHQNFSSHRPIGSDRGGMPHGHAQRTRESVRNQFPTKAHLGDWNLVREVLDGRYKGCWPLPWLIQVIPTAWFPVCNGHRAPKGRAPRLLCRLTFEEQSVRLDPNGDLSIEVMDCIHDQCRAAHQWSHTQARFLWTSLVTAVKHLLSGDPWVVDIAALPSVQDCAVRLMHQNWIAHADFPIPVVIANICRHFYGHAR